MTDLEAIDALIQETADEANRLAATSPAFDRIGAGSGVGVRLAALTDSRWAVRQARMKELEAEAEVARIEVERVAALPGQVNFFRDASASFDTYTKAPTVEQKTWMRDHYHRMRVYSPYFDTRTDWFPNGVVYQDAYALYVDSTPNPDPRVLKDDVGRPLYVAFKTDGRYQQYAADITNPAWRSAWIAQAKAKLAKGYKALFVDDVNYYRKIVRADGTVPTSSPCFAGTLTDGVWRMAMALFMWQIRTELPGVEITHNCVWSVNKAAAELAEVGYPAADYVEVERGVNDSGITGGPGQFSLRALLDWVDRRHEQGVGVIWDSQAKGDAEREYGLACYLLTNNGNDMLGSREGGTPGDWWAGYDTVLGKPLDDRERLLPSGLYYRQFEHGHVYVNEPGAKPVTLAGGRVLGPASGAVILSAEQAIRSAREEHRERKTI